MATNYNNRVWLNVYDSHYTGSIVCVDKTDLINRGHHLERYTFMEISDCHGKIRIHTDPNFGMEAYIEKLKRMEHEIRAFREHLEREEANESVRNTWLR